MTKKILLIDDDRELGELLQEYLSLEGYELSVRHDGETGLAEALTGNHALVLLDVMMPKMNGFDVLMELRKTSSIPVIMLTARGESTDRVLGLRHGADDYIPKPYHHHELIARIEALFRRIDMQNQRINETDSNAKSDIDIQTSLREVRLKGDLVELTGAEFNILLALYKKRGEVVDKDYLSEEGLDRKLTAYDRSIDMHISNLRKKLGERTSTSGSSEPWIKTVRGKGYVLLGENS